MRKLDLAKQVKDRVGGLSKKESTGLICTLLDIVSESLAAGEAVKISGFGTFAVRSKASRRGRNPHTGEELVIPARRVLTFKPSQRLRDVINGS